MAVNRNVMKWTKEEDEALKLAAQEHPDDARAAAKVYLTLGGRPRTYRGLANRLYILTGSQAGLGQRLMKLNDAGEAMAGATLRKGSRLAKKAERDALRAARQSSRQIPLRGLDRELATPVNGNTTNPAFAPATTIKAPDERVIRWAVDGFTLGAISSDELVAFLNRSRASH